MAKTKQVAPAEQLQTKFHEFIEQMVEAGNHASWEDKSSDFDPESKESVEQYITYYADLVKKVNEKFNAFLSKNAEIYGE